MRRASLNASFVIAKTSDDSDKIRLKSFAANLPGLCTPKDVGARILLEARNDAQKQTAEAMEMDMEESDSEDEGEQPIQHEVSAEKLT